MYLFLFVSSSPVASNDACRDIFLLKFHYIKCVQNYMEIIPTAHCVCNTLANLCLKQFKLRHFPEDASTWMEILH